MPRLRAIQAYQADCPPVHLMVRAYLGIKPATERAKAGSEPDPEAVGAAAELMAERPLDAIQRESIEILKAKGLA